VNPALAWLYHYITHRYISEPADATAKKRKKESFPAGWKIDTSVQVKFWKIIFRGLRRKESP